MSFDSNDYKHNAGGNEKILTPGEHYCRILDVKLEVPPFKPDGYFVTLLLEGPHMGEEFEGILINKDDPSAGRYNGKIATVNASRYPFSTFEYKGKTVERDQQIFQWVNALATQLGVLQDIQKANIKANTIEAYIAAVKPFLTNPEIWATFTIAGREYFKEGYDKPNYNLFFPKKSGKLYPYSALLDDKKEPVKNLLRFNEKEHIVPADSKTSAPSSDEEVESFGGKGSKADDDLPM